VGHTTVVGDETLAAVDTAMSLSRMNRQTRSPAAAVALNPYPRTVSADPPIAEYPDTLKFTIVLHAEKMYNDPRHSGAACKHTDASTPELDPLVNCMVVPPTAAICTTTYTSAEKLSPHAGPGHTNRVGDATSALEFSWRI
jgi:hypothetical protein